MEYYTQEELERFNKSWKQVDDCKLWQKYLDKDGYGTFYFRKKGRRAHRVAYYFVNGPIPDGMVIDHICKKTRCVCIKHLRLITTKENALENSNSLGAINKNKIVCKNGHPFDRKYGKQRYCSICQSIKTKRLRKRIDQKNDWRRRFNSGSICPF